MKIAYIDISTDGHHMTYLSALTASKDYESVLILPEKVDIPCKQYVYTTNESKKRSLKTFLKWVNEVYGIVEKEKPDVVHFLYGDAFYRFFGAGLRKFKKYKTIVTLHWARNSFIEKISTRMICACADVIVVHSEYIKELFADMGIKNVVHVEYPQFNKRKVSKKDACAYWGLDETVPTIVCIGNTRYDKGLDILLEALKNVKKPFRLLIAGKEETFDKKYIMDAASSYKDNIRFCLRYLSDEELSNALGAADIVVLPYRKVFDGASGPLGEGVALDKCIVAPDHGTLGYTVKRNHLGYTFESENVDSLSDTVKVALEQNFSIDDNYKKYKDLLNPVFFARAYKNLYFEI